MTDARVAGLELAGGWGRSLGTVLLAGVGGGLFAALAVLFLPRLRPLLAGREKVDRRIAQRAREVDDVLRKLARHLTTCSVTSPLEGEVDGRRPSGGG